MFNRMANTKTILITGAAGNLGTKLRHHLAGRYPLRLLDRDPRGDATIMPADLDHWNPDWFQHFAGIDTVVHLAADPTAHQTWEKLLGPNLDAVIHCFQAAVRHGVRRVIYASSNHVLGGYSEDATRLTTDIVPQPGARYVSQGEHRDSTPYGSAKLFGERLGKCYAAMHDLSVLAVRIGWVRPGENRAEDVPLDRGPWFRLMWLSNRDYCQLMEKCIEADPSIRFAVLHGMSANTGMRWDIEPTRQLLGYEPVDDVTRGRT